jgi:hypothetical protein
MRKNIKKILYALEKLIELNGELYLDNFKNTQKMLILMTSKHDGYYYIYKQFNFPINKQTLIDNYHLLNYDSVYNILFGGQHIYNLYDLFKFMDEEGRIPEDKFLEHIYNLENKHIENSRFIRETLSMFNTIFDPSEYEIKYVNDGCYPNESNRDETLVKNYFIIKKIKDNNPLKNIVQYVDQIVLPKIPDEIHMKRIFKEIEMLQKDKLILNIRFNFDKSNPILMFDYFHDSYKVIFPINYPFKFPIIHINDKIFYNVDGPPNSIYECLFINGLHIN